ncbi:hypothetical protein GA0061099_10653 [Bradyrhizobium yuanmingense]|uniref:Uncharacterized protein n=1 Tax=Bradyrhizobium yuanmingense TaxID=108015 RepID=A0A1C3XN16_9BRAD|nr:hypothetical protein [Bradyrhizobium yuanmingense]TWI19011.1 hypothetical protein IQ15_07037 [Bradyrhizobium yuanmingense]SCB53446.1 hypothetical protein GA0061099_10653 [Bradyrhizobium yuanmingense]
MAELDEAYESIERLSARCHIAVTALRRIKSLGEKNVPKYAQEIAVEALARLDQPDAAK